MPVVTVEVDSRVVWRAPNGPDGGNLVASPWIHRSWARGGGQLPSPSVGCPAAIGDLYQVDPSRVRIFELANLHVIKVSFPRNVPAGSFDDRDLHAGQQHVLLAGLTVPVRLSPRGAAITEGSKVK
jgi:Domain of unknown function (DUF4387)